MADDWNRVNRHLLARSIAYTIDSFITMLLISISFAGILVAMVISPDPEHMTGPAIVICAGSLLVGMVLGYGYFLLRDGFAGRSVGKRICGLQVIHDETGETCGFGRSALRNFILLIVGALDLVIPFFRENGKRLGDEAAKTRVIGVR